MQIALTYEPKGYKFDNKKLRNIPRRELVNGKLIYKTKSPSGDNGLFVYKGRVS